VIWASDSTGSQTAGRGGGAGRAVTAANEEVLFWDIKKSELLGRWGEKSCSAEVTALARSQADPDIYAAGYDVQ
jgi:U3 small nucleolar RNA-associated protein 12